MSVALVIGAAGAIGGAIRDVLVAAGWTVAGADLRGANYDVDVADEGDVARLVDAIVRDLGGLQAVVNCAGITADAPLHKMTLASFRSVVQVNLEGTFLVTRAALQHMRTREGGGRIVNISSMSARLGNFGQANYAASKAGVIALTRVAAREGARYGITANAVLPGFIDTPMTAALDPAVVRERLATIPLARAGRATEVADATLWLCSPGAAYVTGTTVEVAGGRGL
ncbi:MAG TPA: SDR family NAD(P)-dependent oxidoreductase [Acidimicrobiia bacterium]|nr:SDR family NAD(P)-dependent oxidoreductase [Acidimicrobiia bacterium]